MIKTYNVVFANADTWAYRPVGVATMQFNSTFPDSNIQYINQCVKHYSAVLAKTS